MFDDRLESILKGDENKALRAIIKPIAYTTIATLVAKGGLSMVSQPANLTRKDYDKIRDSYVNLVYRTDALLKTHQGKKVHNVKLGKKGRKRYTVK